jgi:hypothetical protein
VLAGEVQVALALPKDGRRPSTGSRDLAVCSPAGMGQGLVMALTIAHQRGPVRP